MRWKVLGPVGLIVLAAGALPAVAPAASFKTPPTSSPITTSFDGRFVWSVNPGADSVSVISTRTNRVVRTVRVGDEPRSVALDTRNRFAFVANAASSNVSVVRLSRVRAGSLRARQVRRITTGAEPWNIVSSRDGRRIFVANSAQDTVTVLDALRPRVIGHVNLNRGRCGLAGRHFQPRGLAVTANNKRLYVTSFFAFTRDGGLQGTDTGRQGVVCRLNINTKAKRIRGYRVARRINVAPRLTGFKVDSTNDGVPDNTSAFPNQLQSIVVRGNQAYLPNIAASPEGPLRFNTSTMAFVNVINGVRRGRDADSGSRFINLHLGARNPEDGKKRLFFANPWGMAFVPRGGADQVYGNAAASGYVIAAGSDLVVKVFVRRDGKLVNTVDNDTTRYIDLADPNDPATAGDNAGHNPQGITANRSGTRLYTMNFVSRNVSVINTVTDRVVRVIRTTPLPAPGSPEEVVNVGAQMFFGSRGQFDRPAGATVLTSERLSSEGWQSCSSCHFNGLTDSVVWRFGSGPRKSLPLNSTFGGADRASQKVLNYSGVNVTLEDFENNVRATSGPGNLAVAAICSDPPPATSTLDPNHGLIIGDNGDINTRPCTTNGFAKSNVDRRQVTVTLPGSDVAVPAMTAMREWVRRAIRTPNGPLTRRGSRPGDTAGVIAVGRRLFESAGCASCHGGPQWTSAILNVPSPPPAADVATETTPPPAAGRRPVAAQYLFGRLKDIGSFNVGVPGQGNDLGGNIGATELAAAGFANGVSSAPLEALGIDYNGDGKGNGYNPSSVLGIFASPPYYHNGACETLACVVSDLEHRTANGTRPDGLDTARERRAVVAYLKSIDAGTRPRPQP